MVRLISTLTPRTNPLIKKNQSIHSIFQQIRPILLSHHPNCEPFHAHTVQIGGLHLCIGCFVGYPAAVIGVFISFIGLMAHWISLPQLLWVSVGCLAVLFLSFTSLTRYKKVKILQKSFFGFGAGAFLTFNWQIFPWGLAFNIVWAIFIFSSLNMPVSVVHLISHQRVCEACPLPTCEDPSHTFKVAHLKCKTPKSG